jgi:hypothetical protein
MPQITPEERAAPQPVAPKVQAVVDAWNNLDPEHLLAIEYSSLGDAIAALYAVLPEAPKAPEPSQMCLPNGLLFDAFGEPRTRYVRVSLDGNHCVMHPSEGDRYLQDARDNGDESAYVVADVYLSEREFDDLPEHDGF